ncbi:delta-class carbonic anhydrase [Primorskyibacter sp. S87]|uniref:delta-class carbonic anhydrase n=1 Tax=Primorskyibacter sp. S87 TaxID=3415126 RepID=UPI003C7A8BEF
MKLFAFSTATLCLTAGAAFASGICTGFGPQAPRDISESSGANKTIYSKAPEAAQMNLCDIHLHRNAEHKGPGFSTSGGAGEHGGWMCNDSSSLSEAQLADPFEGQGPLKGVTTGDTIEVHWVFTTCDVAPGHSLGSCFSESCINPQLRVEAQVFSVINDANALDFALFTYGSGSNIVNGLHQPNALPDSTGTPIVYVGSTTGPSYTEENCSPYLGTWSVRPQCAQIDVSSLHKWAESNVFEENHAHGVRQIVTSEALLSPIK